MAWAAVATTILLVGVLGAAGVARRRRRGGRREIDPAAFRQALDAMAPNAGHRERTIQDSAPSPPPEPKVIDARPRTAEPVGEHEEHERDRER